ncbi:MAG: hypothetical protein HFH11_10140 [Dorea sp.]|jgi:hypothetical protein|nr:hypothetical protein [Clostridiales bacterium]MCI9271489.1 hypothetical protein [Dorea sp.]
MKKTLPIKVNASIQTECWTYNKLCILETSPYSDAWISSNFGIYMDPEYLVCLGRINTTFYLNEFSNILEISEMDYWKNTPNTIVGTIEAEIQKGNYLVIYLMLSVEEHTIHEFVFYGFDSEKHELYTLMLNQGTFKKKTVSYDWFITHYKNLYDYHLYNPDNIAWFGSNFFPITKIKVRDDFNDSICFVEAMRRFNEELLGKRILISNPITSTEEQYLTGIECINGISLRVKEYIRDQQFIKGNTLKKLSFEMQRNVCKLYEHHCVVNKSMKWIMKQVETTDEHYIQLHWNLCERMKKLAMLSMKFDITGNWDILNKMDKGLENLYDAVKDSLCGFIDSVTVLKKNYNKASYNDLLKKHPSILAETEHFNDEQVAL